MQSFTSYLHFVPNTVNFAQKCLNAFPFFHEAWGESLTALQKPLKDVALDYQWAI